MLTTLPDEIQELVWLMVAAQDPKTAILASRVSSQTRNILNQTSFWQRACQAKGINVDPMGTTLASLQHKLILPNLDIDMCSAAAGVAANASECKILVCGRGCFDIPELLGNDYGVGQCINKINQGARQLAFHVLYSSLHYLDLTLPVTNKPHAVLLCPDSIEFAQECIGFANNHPEMLFFIVQDETKYALTEVAAAIKHKNILAVPQDYQGLCKVIADALDKITAHQMSVASAPAHSHVATNSR